MGKRFDKITDEHKKFIAGQKIFFTGTAATEGRVNVSPKGLDSLRVVDDHTVVWLNLTGSGNETAAHLQEHNRMTLMFCAFEGNPYILRLYGQAEILPPDHPERASLMQLFPKMNGIRQVILMKVDLVQKSCGYAVPLYDFVESRDVLTKWTDKKSDTDLEQYWSEKNALSLDGKPIDKPGN
ncbi:MAG: pyridoxamine 5'-phosphate oxidase family protein [Saprospiraceae bacterium]|nr:pyridoxamine 5'-phosphate oxidase family protein [Saprospiraceae bacterium]MCB9323067.1 pyridoxamine 5'-phosphate oxidase family protein [Lewinellaceae bacterium]